jgi:hypothetical protein
MKPSTKSAKPPTKSKPETPAMKRSRFNIEVTERDIEKAKRNDSYICIVSQAIARAIPDATRIETDTQTIRFSHAGERFVFLTPYAVQGYVIAFDAGDPIQPFTFQLRDPVRVKSQKLTAKGRAGRRAYAKAYYATARKARAKGDSLDNPEVQADMREAATTAYAEATRNMDGKSADYTSHRPAPPKVFKRKHRSYGHRLLRINQQEAG